MALLPAPETQRRRGDSKAHSTTCCSRKDLNESKKETLLGCKYCARCSAAASVLSALPFLRSVLVTAQEDREMHVCVRHISQ